MKNLRNLFTLGLASWTVLVASIALSEPYRVVKGDTLSRIAAAHNVTVKQLTATNQITNANLLRVGQVITIPEPPSSIGPLGSPDVHPRGSPPAPHETVRNAAEKSTAISDLRTGLGHGWVVTQNGEGKIFVHERESSGMLMGLRYLIRETESPNGTTSWTVYRPSEGSDGTHSYGRIVGVIDRPSRVSVTSCTCE